MEGEDRTPERPRIPYMKLLNTLASDLDYMLNDLYTAPPSLLISGDAFLEPYMQGLGNDLSSTPSPSDSFQNGPPFFTRQTSSSSTDQAHSRRRSSYGIEENQEDQVIPLLASPLTDVPDTPLSETDPSASGFTLMLKNKRLPGGGSNVSLNHTTTSGDDCSDISDETDTSLDSEEETPCDISLLERLIRSHPIWFLPGIQRAGAFHLLQGKEDGNFVVRQSSQNSTMAISVRLPSGKGPYIEHYLIQGDMDGQIGLESSDNKFNSIPLLIAHYCQCCDELPVQLTLPRAIREAKSRQQLSSLALLGQEFWRYPMAEPRSSQKSDEEMSSLVVASSKDETQQQCDSVISSTSNSPPSSLSSFDSSGNKFDLDSSSPLNDSSSQPSSLMTTFKGSSPAVSLPHNQIGIPVSPECITSLSFSSALSLPSLLTTATANVTSSPVETSQTSNASVITTSGATSINVRRSRPTPPNTLNLVSATSICSSATSEKTDCGLTVATSPIASAVSATSKTPPPPPPRWAKPAFSTCGNTMGTHQQNFTVTTTLTFSVNNKETCPPPQLQVSCIQITSPVVEKEEQQSLNIICNQTTSVITPVSSALVVSSPPQSLETALSSTPITHTPQILSPVSEGNTRPFHKKNRRHRESRHYQESDILESAVLYNRSAVADKASDYEDIWGPESSLVTFKPNQQPRASFSSLDDFTTNFGRKSHLTPDILEQTTSQAPAPQTPVLTSESAVSRKRSGVIITTAATSSVAASPPVTSPEMKSPTQENVKSPSDPTKQPASPFYAEPADAIKHQAALLRKKLKPVSPGQQILSNRHSDPASFHQWQPITSGCNQLERIDSKEELVTSNQLSTSVDNLISLRNSRRSIGNCAPFPKSVKPVHPPKVGGLMKKKSGESPWTVDSSWEFIGNDADDLKAGADAEEAFKNSTMCSSDSLTVQDMIYRRLPKLTLSPICIRVVNNSSDFGNLNCSDQAFSERTASLSYDSNISNGTQEQVYRNGASALSHISDNSDDANTEFSEPWDSSNWEHLLPKPIDGGLDVGENGTQINRCKSFKERLDPLLSPPRLKALARTRAAAGTGTSPGATVRAYALQLAADKSTVFAQSIDNFIACTKESRETKPQVVMRNMRQFMSGMKNYLLKHGEGEFEKEVEKERSKLKANEFMNLDAILEGVMHKLVIVPLKDHLYNLFVDQYVETGSVQSLAESVQYARTRPAQDLGLRDKIIPPSEEDLKKIFGSFNNLQIADSPLEKLEHLLSAIATIFHSVKVLNKGPEAVTLGADDFLPLFVWVLVQSGMVAAEIEAEFMWGLLHPSLLSGEGGYYLTTLSSAVSVLKNFKECSDKELHSNTPWCHDPLAEFRSVLKVVVPDELNGSLLTKTLPVRPNMTTKDICKIIALKLRITNPQDYSLFKLVDGEETLLNDTDCPQDVKSETASTGKHCIFAYKRLDAKIAWPRTTSPNHS